MEMRKGSIPRESWGGERSPGNLEQPGSPEKHRNSLRMRTWRRPLSLYMPDTPGCESMSGDKLDSPNDSWHRPLSSHKPALPRCGSLSDDKPDTPETTQGPLLRCMSNSVHSPKSSCRPIHESNPLFVSIRGKLPCGGDPGQEQGPVTSYTPVSWVRSKLNTLCDLGIAKLVGKTHTLACAHPLCEIPSGSRAATVPWVNPVSRRGMKVAERLVQASLDLPRGGDKVPIPTGVQHGPAACENGVASLNLGSEGIWHSELSPTEKNESMPHIRHALGACPSSPCTLTADQGSPVQVYQVASPQVKTGRYGLGEGPDCTASSINHAYGGPGGPESHRHQGPWYPLPLRGEGLM